MYQNMCNQPLYLFGDPQLTGTFKSVFIFNIKNNKVFVYIQNV